MLPLNNNLRKLFNMAQKDWKLGIGLMSGTSLDGLDIALCRFSGNGLQTRFELLNFTTTSYSDRFKQKIKTVFAQKEADLEKVCLLNEYVGSFHATLVLQALVKWEVSPESIDFIASHGQTIYHAPKRLHKTVGYPSGTLQIGDADHLAMKTGIFTISDFRQKHLAAGGEGAPLALYGDVILGIEPGENRILLNIGGIANLTYLPGDGNTEQILCTDIGPGNTLIDAACREYFNLPYDEDSNIAFLGEVNEALLNELLEHPFFTDTLPKTTGPELFNLGYVKEARQNSGTENISNEDLISTLSAFSARCISDFIQTNIKADDIKLFVSGGGANNPYIMEQLEERLPDATIASTSKLGINPDAKEAILFALLGNEALCGEPLQIGDNPTVLMGKFSFAR